MFIANYKTISLQLLTVTNTNLLYKLIHYIISQPLKIVTFWFHHEQYGYKAISQPLKIGFFMYMKNRISSG